MFNNGGLNYTRIMEEDKDANAFSVIYYYSNCNVHSLHQLFEFRHIDHVIITCLVVITKTTHNKLVN